MNARTLDPRNPWVISVHKLLRGPGEQITVTANPPAPEGMGVALLGVPEGTEVDLDLRLESVSEGVLVSGTVTAELTGQCSRCLTDISDEITAEVQELYYYPGQETEDEEDLFVVDEYIDLEPPVRDAVVVDLPFTPLCREDCAGLCPVCGVDLNENPDHEHDEAVDPRWEKLAGLVDEAEDDGKDD